MGCATCVDHGPALHKTDIMAVATGLAGVAKAWWVPDDEESSQGHREGGESTTNPFWGLIAPDAH
jgi:hypothetical protein